MMEKDKNNPQWITHKVVVLQKPQIVTSHNQANLTVIKGKNYNYTSKMKSQHIM